MYKTNTNPAESVRKYTLFLALNLKGLSMDNPNYLNLSGTKQHSPVGCILLAWKNTCFSFSCHHQMSLGGGAGVGPQINKFEQVSSDHQGRFPREGKLGRSLGLMSVARGM